MFVSFLDNLFLLYFAHRPLRAPFDANIRKQVLSQQVPFKYFTIQNIMAADFIIIFLNQALI